MHRLAQRKGREAPERLGRHLLGQKLGQRPESHDAIPRFSSSGPTIVGPPSDDIGDLGSLGGPPLIRTAYGPTPHRWGHPREAKRSPRPTLAVQAGGAASDPNHGLNDVIV